MIGVWSLWISEILPIFITSLFLVDTTIRQACAGISLYYPYASDVECAACIWFVHFKDPDALVSKLVYACMLVWTAKASRRR
jgi:hypothetical protein